MNLPVHPLTGLTAIGWRKARTGENGKQPIWPQLGGAPEGEEGEGAEEGAEESDDAEEGAVEGEDALGDAGKRALDKMKADLRAERTRRKAAENEAAALKSSKSDGDDDAKQDLDAVRADALKQARAETLRERALDRLEARAGRRLNDPADARAHLASRVEEFIDGEQIDSAAIDEALAELLETKPYLGATGAKPRFEGTGDNGARKGANGPKQLGKADLTRMSADQIVAAQKAGQFDDYLATET